MNNYIKNGFYIPFLHAGMYYFTKNFFLSTIIALKMYPMNFMYHFNCNKTIPTKYNFLKPFVRYTDYGQIALFIYYFYPNFLQVVYNIQFLITSSYWSGKLLFGIKDTDTYSDKQIVVWFVDTWSYLGHLLPYYLMVHEITPETVFTKITLLHTYIWTWIWFLFIYLPWRYLTKDPVYSVLSKNESVKNKLVFYFSVHFFIYIANLSGNYILQ